MAHFAELDEENVVVNVVVVDNSVMTIPLFPDNPDGPKEEREELGIAYLQAMFGAHSRWVQTSYSGSMRRKYAAIGDTYVEEVNAFFTPEELTQMEVVEWQSELP